jgi:hypothetical protein
MLLAAICLMVMSCGEVHHVVRDEIAKASVSRGKLSGKELEDCTRALRQAGQLDLLRVTGGTSEYNHSTHTTMYYPHFLLERGGWGTAVIKVTGPTSEPTLLVLNVERHERHGR